MARPANRHEPMIHTLLEVYLDLALRDSIHSLNLRHLAEKADVAYSTVHYYFGPPNNIVDEALDYVAENAQSFMRAAMESALWDSNKSLVSTYVSANFSWLKQHQSHAAFWLYCIHLGAGRSQYHERVNQRFFDGQKRILEILKLEKQRKAGLDMSSRDLTSISRSLHALLLGSMTQASLDSAKKIESYRAEVEKHFERYLSSFMR